MNKKQLVILYILGAIVVVSLIAAVIVIRKNASNNKAQEATSGSVAENTDDTSKSATPANVSDMVNDMTADMGLETTVPLDEEKIAYYYGVNKEDMAECAGVIGDVALADELVIMKAASSDKVEALKKGAKMRLENQKKAFQDYIPKEFKRLDQTQIITSGDYVMFVCSDNADTIVKNFQDMTK